MNLERISRGALMNPNEKGEPSALKSDLPPPYEPIQFPATKENIPQNVQIRYNQPTTQITEQQFLPHPHSYPYTISKAPVDITKCKEPNVALCPSCNFVGMTRVEKKFSTCQIVLGILFICSAYMIIPGILILIFAFDYEHCCSRCNCIIGRN